MLKLFKSGIVDYWKNLLSIKFRMLTNQANSNTEISYQSETSSTESTSSLILFKFFGYGMVLSFGIVIFEIINYILVKHM